jgi:hypothetical protein
MKNDHKTRNILLIVVSLLLVLIFMVFVFEKTHVINLYTKPIKTSPTAARPVNDISYAPATSTETEEGNQIKQALIDQANNPPAPTSKVNVSLSAATQDVKGGPVIVRAIVGTTGGTCSLTLSQGSTNKVYSSEVVNLGTYYGCKGFDIPASDLVSGQWQLNLKVTNGQSSGEANQNIEVAT